MSANSHHIIAGGQPVENANPLPVAIRPAAAGDYIADTTAHDGNWNEITALEAAVAALVATDLGGTLTAVPIPAGTTVRGKFTRITLASGKVLAYRL